MSNGYLNYNKLDSLLEASKQLKIKEKDYQKIRTNILNERIPLDKTGKYSIINKEPINNIKGKKKEEPSKNNKESNNIFNKENNIYFVKNKYDFNYLEILYKSTFNNIWEYYLRNINYKINFHKIDFKNLIKSSFIKKPLSSLSSLLNIAYGSQRS